MKSLFIAMIALAATAAQANIWHSAATSNWPTKPTKKYKLDMYGYDARAYEFITENGMRCVAVFPGGSAQGWQLQCLPASGGQQPEKK
jgi:hypothetical protein